MWLSQRSRQGRREESQAQVGQVTLPGNPAGVYSAGERREMPVFGPGGYQWKPEAGQEVLVLKTGEEGETPCVAGTRYGGSLEPGEIQLFSNGGASIALRRNGNVEIVAAKVLVNGVPLTLEPPAEGGDDGDGGNT